MTEEEYIYLFGRMTTIGPVNYDRMLALYGSAEAAWRCDNPMLNSQNQRREWKLLHMPQEEAKLLMQKERMEAQEIRFLHRDAAEYPEAFSCLADPPIGVFVQGRLPQPYEDTVAIIGSRQCTPYGRACAAHLAEELARRHIWVISGMALGIDACGQRAALGQGGLSLAVLGSGIDVCYPTENEQLFEQLKKKGGILSEYGPGEAGLAFHFPLRNRLISALSKVIVVVEARRKSGTLITVDQALEQGKNVLAVPGRIDDPMSVGCNDLLRQGAGVCAHADDILRELGWSESRIRGSESGEIEKQMLTLTFEEKQVLDLLMYDPIHIDRLAESTGRSIGDLMVVLWGLEQKKLCRQVSSHTYQRC